MSFKGRLAVLVLVRFERVTPSHVIAVKLANVRLRLYPDRLT